MPLALSLSFAPYQCAKEREPAAQREETPAEALYGLAEEFRARGDEEAYRATLEYLVARYPSSRFAKAAQMDLEELGNTSSPHPPALSPASGEGGP